MVPPAPAPWSQTSSPSIACQRGTERHGRCANRCTNGAVRPGAAAAAACYDGRGRGPVESLSPPGAGVEVGQGRAPRRCRPPARAGGRPWSSSASDGGETPPFGALLREQRRAAGLTQEALAERAGLGPRTVQALEGGAARPHRDTVTRLARALALSPAAAAGLAAAGAEPPPGAREGPPPALFVIRGRAAPDPAGTAAAVRESPGSAPTSLRDEGGPPPWARRGPPVPAAPPVRHNLPAPLTGLVGRERELAAVAGRLAEARLLTLTGPGGGGKTRLALALATRLAGTVPGASAPGTGIRPAVGATGDGAGPARATTVDGERPGGYQDGAADDLPGGGAGSALYPDGVWLAELGALADPALVPQAAAAAVGVREAPGRPLTESLCRALRGRRLLLVLDNCEHLLEACATLATALLRACPGIRILATSRRPLGLAGEATWSVPPLSWPAGPAGEELPPAALPAPAALLEYGAVRLFVERARDARPAFALTAANAPAVVRVCARLDGLPLALELAARQSVVLPPAALAARLDARFRLLTGGGPAAHPRQRTLAATLDWSHALLGEAERALFRRLAVFVGGWTLDAAEAVCADDPGGGNEEGQEGGGAGVVAADAGGAAPRGHLPAEAVLEALRRLADQSLVVAVHDLSAEATRYRLLETVRQYAAERLAAAGEGDTVRARHAAWAVALAEQGARGALGAHREVWQERLEREQDNFRAALSWALSDPSRPERPDREDPTAPAADVAGAGLVALQLSGALWRFWSTTGATAEGRVWLERALAGAEQGAAGLPAPAGRRADVAALRARALLGAGALAGRQGDFRAARGYDERSSRPVPGAGRLARDRRGPPRPGPPRGVPRRHRRGAFAVHGEPGGRAARRRPGAGGHGAPLAGTRPLPARGRRLRRLSLSGRERGAAARGGRRGGTGAGPLRPRGHRRRAGRPHDGGPAAGRGSGALRPRR